MGHSNNLYNRRTRAYCACSRCWWGCLGIFFSSINSLVFSFSLRDSSTQTEVVSVRAVKSKTTKEFSHNNLIITKSTISCCDLSQPLVATVWSCSAFSDRRWVRRSIFSGFCCISCGAQVCCLEFPPPIFFFLAF